MCENRSLILLPVSGQNTLHRLILIRGASKWATVNTISAQYCRATLRISRWISRSYCLSEGSCASQRATVTGRSCQIASLHLYALRRRGRLWVASSVTYSVVSTVSQWSEVGAVTSPDHPQRRSTLRQADPSMHHPGTGCMTPYKGRRAKCNRNCTLCGCDR
ncbi:hypothetical protein BU25DRAFT_172896 [Macroventuria anomochaeta]|uniref:Uncharacterized protein n=1 Tax=Macroventuria anomochaeta TaxID=301207 RepID=A0ACB6RP76_9PLEO|nr:uncharacterized protein BU25DRAFT_172896 [Macroventuria anomochaeta]KAF2623696.1 hypothetical protein BU25DRAFT_172896 [Macroventuria anomochaeta]